MKKAYVVGEKSVRVLCFLPKVPRALTRKHSPSFVVKDQRQNGWRLVWS